MANNADFFKVCKDRDEWRDRAEEMARRLDERYRAGFDEGWGRAAVAAIDSMPYPVDAEDVPIRIGDVLEGDHPFFPAKVIGYKEVCEKIMPLVTNGSGERWVYPTETTHYVEPDVEDVLRDLLEEHRRWFDGESELTISEMVKEAAAKLRMGGD